ncbi:MAG: C-GCAxxG-C-C family protein [Anaerolineaceae bacterium]|nr:C-GCAxxG-C-C family protein [Anaerolineaceae bacterium]
MEKNTRIEFHQTMQKEWASKAEKAYSLGFEYEKIYHGCGQCVLAAVMDTLGKKDDGAFNAATNFSGGLGLYGKSTCSALLGGAMVFGLLYPRDHANFAGARETKYRSFDMTQRLIAKYEERYKSIICHDIHAIRMGRSFDLRSSEQRVLFEEAGAHSKQCTETVALAAEWTIEIIGEELIKDKLNHQNKADDE